MGTVKYSGPVASFHCPTEATIRSLKVHFSPKQEGSGTPSPENVREIVGWDGVEVQQSGKNLWGGSAMKEAIENVFPIISTENNVITYSNSWASQADGSVLFSTFKPNTQYTLILTYSKSTNVYTHIAFLYSDGSFTMHNRVAPDNPNTKTTEIYVSKADKTLTAIIRKADEYSNVTLYCDESGLFEGIRTKSEFEPYHGSTTNYEFGVLGKNKFDVSKLSAEKEAWTIDILDLPPATYTMSSNKGTVADTSIYMYFRITGNSTLSNANVVYSEHSVTLTIEKGQTAEIVYRRSSGTNLYSDYNWQIELGSTATTYEPYDPNHTVYGGWVDLVSGEVQEEWIKINIPVTQTLGGQLNGYNRDISTERYFQISSPSLGTHQALLSNKAISANCRNDNEQFRIGPDGTSLIHYALPNSTLGITTSDTVDDRNSKIIAWLTENPIEVVYNLKNPNTYNLPPNSSELKTFLSQNNIWSNADYVEVEYDLHETQNILARKQFIIANQPHVVTPAAAPLQNFVTDMAAPLKECKVHFGPKQDLNGYSKPWVGGSGKNLFNAATSTPKKYIGSDGNIHVSDDWSASDYIAVTPSETYTISGADAPGGTGCHAFYDSNKDFVSAVTGYDHMTFTVPEEAMYVRFSVRTETPTTVQLEVGSAATAYEPWENVCSIGGWDNVIFNKSGKNLIREDAEWYSFKCRPSNNVLIGSSYNTIVVPVPVGTIRIHQGHVAGSYINYVCLADKLPEEGDIIYEGASKSGWTNYTVDNSAGHPYLLIHGPTSTPTVTPSEWSRINENYVLLGEYEGNGYDPVQGATIPVTFPSVINVLSSTTITTNKTLSSTGEETSETGMSLTNYIKVNEGNIYKLTFTSKEGARTRRIYGYDANKEPVESLASASWVTVDTVGTIQATIPSGVEYIRACYKTADENIFLEGPESSVIYGGYVDLVNGELVQEWHTISIDETTPMRVFTPDARSQGTYCNASYWLSTFNAPNGAGYEPYSYDGFCNKLVYYENNYAQNSRAAAYNSTADICLEGVRSQEDYLTWLTENGPITICYRLKDPIHYSLTTTQLKTLRGTNNVWSNAGDITLSYWKH